MTEQFDLFNTLKEVQEDYQSYVDLFKRSATPKFKRGSSSAKL